LALPFHVAFDEVPTKEGSKKERAKEKWESKVDLRQSWEEFLC
jgi:hypothetical protein